MKRFRFPNGIPRRETPMNLRDRIAAVIDREVDGFWEPLDVADAVIAELGLRQERVGLLTRNVTEWQQDD